MSSSQRGELAIRSWELKGVKVSVDKTKENNYEIYHLIIANILFNLNSCNNIILCRYYQKVLSTLIHNTFTFSFNFDNPAIFLYYFLSWYLTCILM